MNSTPELFGLFGFTHGWAKILTVMSPQGATATINAIGDRAGVVSQTAEGKLPRFHEQREGALDRLIEEHGVVILTRNEWDARKEELGETIFL